MVFSFNRYSPRLRPQLGQKLPLKFFCPQAGQSHAEEAETVSLMVAATSLATETPTPKPTPVCTIPLAIEPPAPDDSFSAAALPTILAVSD